MKKTVRLLAAAATMGIAAIPSVAMAQMQYCTEVKNCLTIGPVTLCVSTTVCGPAPSNVGE